MVGGDENLLCDLARMFCTEGPKLLTGAREALLRNDCHTLRHASHALKGSVSTFAAQRATEAAARLEDLAASGELGGAKDAYETLDAQVEAAKGSARESYQGKRADS